jgi:hypothetical protein
MGMAELQRRFADGRPFVSEVTTVGEARALSEQARALGLELQTVKELASIDEDKHTWIADGSDATPFARGPGVHAIGWLSPAHRYHRGPAPPGLGARLHRLVTARTWLPVAAGGAHTCAFCGSARGAQAILVPDGAVLFVAPDLVGHYVEEHDYLPCDAFVQAVAACPDPTTPAYFQMLRPFARLWPGSPLPRG